MSRKQNTTKRVQKTGTYKAKRLNKGELAELKTARPQDSPRRIYGREAAGNCSARRVGLVRGLAELKIRRRITTTNELGRECP